MPLNNVGVIVLAGGAASRLGGVNKALCLLNGKPLIEYVLETFGKAASLVISANRDSARLRQYGFAVAADETPYQHRGPLAGIVSAARLLPPKIEYIQVLPCDAPYLPECVLIGLHERLAESSAEIVCAATPMRMHPIVCQFRRRHLVVIEQQLADGGKGSVRSIIEPYAHSTVYFADEKWFHNFNRTEDWING
ncbi:NTP transferase domain-containing protein [Stenoxybacter acetivorans]|uniref:NTP transferase domain-containing protein n=1 Tax=Stenoxybacter acetivorans TaxID=422441 RepID=UPI0006925594|nr:NTP transferase domain-containing protein [Stenoxybacter acetivorans]